MREGQEKKTLCHAPSSSRKGHDPNNQGGVHDDSSRRQRLRAPPDRILIEHNPVPISTLLARITSARHHIALALILALHIPELITTVAFLTPLNTRISESGAGASSDTGVRRVVAGEVRFRTAEEATRGGVDEAADLFKGGWAGGGGVVRVDGQTPAATTGFFVRAGAGGGALAIGDLGVDRELVGAVTLGSSLETSIAVLLIVAEGLAGLDGLGT